MRLSVPEAPGFSLQVSDLPEDVYLLGRADGTEIPVPCRHCGVWNPATLSARHFFFAYEPDVALDIVSARRVRWHIGRLAFPSDITAGPWFARASRRRLLHVLRAFAAEFLAESLEHSPAISRAIGRADQQLAQARRRAFL